MYMYMYTYTYIHMYIYAPISPPTHQPEGWV